MHEERFGLPAGSKLDNPPAGDVQRPNGQSNYGFERHFLCASSVPTQQDRNNAQARTLDDNLPAAPTRKRKEANSA